VNPEQIFSHLKKLVSALSAKQLVGLLLVFLAVVAVVVSSAYYLSTPNYALLVSDMDAETASSVVAKLRTDKVAYELADGGRTVRVDAARADEMRLQFASGGLPSAGRIGFEIFDRPAFGTTEFLEHVNYRRALEGELARTISTLSEVASARVHIAMAKDSLFVDQEQPAKASVVLKLKANRPLPTATVRGIAGLVAGSVESLRPESVVILDTYGRPLTRPGDGDNAGATTGVQLDRQQQIEREMSSRVVALLEPVVGAGRVRVNVAAYLSSDAVEETEERWDPTSVVRSKQSMSETGSTSASVGGVAGARANQPPALSTSANNGAATPPANPAAAAAANAAAPNTPAPAAVTSNAIVATPPGRTSETTNYEVSKLTRHTISPQGQLARLSVAVILDDERVTNKGTDGAVQISTKAWEPAGIQRIHGIVAAAVGLDKDRGDQLTVENISFESSQEDPAPPAPGFGQKLMDWGGQNWPAALRGLAILSVASFALFGVLRPIARRATALTAAPALPAAATGTAARLPTVSEMEGQIEAELDAAAGPGGPKRLPALTKRAAKLASEEPEQLARVVRGWIAEEDHR
jgi:flagellar M-ring protein FliF